MRYRTGHAVRCFSLGVLALLVLAPAWAQDPVAEYEAIKRASLKGLEALAVIVPPLNMDAGCRRVSPGGTSSRGGGRVWTTRALQVGLGHGHAFDHRRDRVRTRDQDLLCGVSMTVALQQVVLLVRDPRIMTFGVTWEHAGLGVATPARLAGTPPAHAGPHGG